MKKSFSSLTTAIAFVAFACFFCMLLSVAVAGEHPEHPSSEHPSKTSKAQAKAQVSLEEVAQFIENHVSKVSDKGRFVIKDPKVDKNLSLTLDHVHRERLAQIGETTFFVCADFKDKTGKVYDLDFFVEGTSKDDLQVISDKTAIHKEAGKARYTWIFNKKTGLWEHKSLSHKGEHKEHPSKEHPVHGHQEHPSEHPSGSH